MDLAAVPTDRRYHPNENAAANTGIFAPGDVIHYFLGAKNANEPVELLAPEVSTARDALVRTSEHRATAMASPCEWSVLPDAGRQPGDVGDILYVDDADDRLVTDFADDRTARRRRSTSTGRSTTGHRRTGSTASTCWVRPRGVGNSLASPREEHPEPDDRRPRSRSTRRSSGTAAISRGVSWATAARRTAGRARRSRTTSVSATRSSNNHPDNPGWAYWGDDVVQDWSDADRRGRREREEHVHEPHARERRSEDDHGASSRRRSTRRARCRRRLPAADGDLLRVRRVPGDQRLRRPRAIGIVAGVAPVQRRRDRPAAL